MNIVFSSLVGGPASAAHIHCWDPPGVAAIVALPFTSFPATTSGTYSNIFDFDVAATYNAPFVTASRGTVALAEAVLIRGLGTGLTYTNIHDAVYPGGEIRGQLAAVPEPATIVLSGAGLLLVAFVCRRRQRGILPN